MSSTPMKFPIPPIDDVTERNLRIREAIDLAIIAESAGCSPAALEAMMSEPANVNVAIAPNHWPMVMRVDASKTPYDVVDEIRAAYRRRTIGRDEAIGQIRRTVSVADSAAADLLDHPLSPNARHGKSQMATWTAPAIIRRLTDQ